MKPFSQDGDVTLYCGDALRVLRELPDESVHCIVTSPPYFALRDYQTGVWEGGVPEHEHDTKGARGGRGGSGTLDKRHADAMPSEVAVGLCSCGAVRVDEQLGLEETPELYVEKMVAVFREARRVLRSDGMCFLVLGDSYASSSTYNTTNSLHDEAGWKQDRDHRPNAGVPVGLKAKDLVMVPAQVALALRADGWYLRKEIIWAKGVSFCDTYSGSCMPESARDRPTSAHEKIYLLTKSPSYFYDADGEREAAAWERWGDQTVPKYEGTDTASGWMQPKTKAELRSGRVGRYQELAIYGDGDGTTPRKVLDAPQSGRNLRDVWAINPEPYAEAHFAVFPSRIPEAAIRLGTSERGCCPECGAPWERETERETVREHGGTREMTKTPLPAVRAGWRDGGPSSQTIGWRPTCDHGHEPVPCVVLDPFMGSGTTALVARRIGRRSIGIDLSADYLRLALQRLSVPDETGAVPNTRGDGHAQMSLLAAAVEKTDA